MSPQMLPATAASAAPPGPQLRDIHLPPAPSWWPPAPGWWMLAALLALGLLALLWWWRRRRALANRQQRVLAQVDQLAEDYRRTGDTAMLASGLHQLLRRVARRHDVRAAQQRGDAWRQTLARVPVDAATLEQLLALEQAIYRPLDALDAAASLRAVRQWLRLALQASRWSAAAEPPYA